MGVLSFCTNRKLTKMKNLLHVSGYMNILLYLMMVFLSIIMIITGNLLNKKESFENNINIPKIIKHLQNFYNIGLNNNNTYY
jgi:hypothetical protein